MRPKSLHAEVCVFAVLPAPSLAVSFRAPTHFNDLFHALYIARSCSNSCVRESSPGSPQYILVCLCIVPGTVK